VKDFHAVGKKMTRNGRKMAKLIGCAFRFKTEFSLKNLLGFYEEGKIRKCIFFYVKIF
jgi:hypothetical protein